MWNLNNRIAKPLGGHSYQLLENAAEMPRNKQPAAFPCREKIITIKNKVNDRLPNSNKVNVIHDCVLGILTEDLAKI